MFLFYLPRRRTMPGISAVADDAGEFPVAPEVRAFLTLAAAFASAISRSSPFTIPHDAADPVGFTFRAEGIKIGFRHRSWLYAC